MHLLQRWAVSFAYSGKCPGGSRKWEKGVHKCAPGDDDFIKCLFRSQETVVCCCLLAVLEESVWKYKLTKDKGKSLC